MSTLLCTLMSASLLAAAAADPEPATRLDRIEVVGERTRPLPAPLGQVDGADATRRAGADAAVLIGTLPGVALRGNGGASAHPVLRGLGGDRVRIRVDDMDLVAACPNHMNPPLSYLDPAALHGATVYAGLAPVSAGGDAIAGVIAARTAPPRFAEAGSSLLEGRLGAGYRDNGDAWRSDASLLLAGDTLSARLEAARARSDNYRAGGDFRTSTATGRVGHTVPLDEVGSSAYDTRNAALTLAARGEDWLSELGFGYQDVPFQGYPNQRMDMTGNTQRRLRFAHAHELAGGSLRLSAFSEEVEHAMDFGPDRRYWYGSLSGSGQPCAPIRFMGDPAGTCAAGMPMRSEADTRGATLSWERSLASGSLLRVGGEWSRQQLEDYWLPSGGGMGPGVFRNIHDGERTRGALYGEWESQPAQAWSQSLGLRLERVVSDADTVSGYSSAPNAMGGQAAEAAAFNARDRRRSDLHVDLSALLRYAPGGAHSLEFGYARRTRSPNLYERYPWSSWEMAAAMNNLLGDGNGYVGNLDLEPETAQTLAATWRWARADGQAQFSVSPWWTRVDDYIDAEPVRNVQPGRFNVLRYANVDAELYGIDAEGRLELGDSVIGHLALDGNASVSRGRRRDGSDPLYEQMPPRLRLGLEHRYGGWQQRLEFEAVARKSRVSQVRNEIETPGYALLGWHLSRQWTQWKLGLGVENLFDRAYALPLGGSYVGQGTTMSLNGIPWGIAVPGAGCTLYASVEWRFNR